MSRFLQAWSMQQRVLGALFMREIQTRWGRRNLGFAWLFFEPLAFAFPVLLMWHMIRPTFEHGLPMMAFLWTGYMPLLIFRHVAGRALYMVRSNAALLYHRSVTPLDIVIAGCGLELIGNLAAVAFSFLVFYLLGAIDWPYNLPVFLAGNLYMAWWAFAVALIVAGASERSEAVEHIWPPISYMYLPVSGFFYMASWLPTSIRHFALLVMPSLHGYEMIRDGLFGNVVETYYDPVYLTYWLAALTVIGLWLLRTVRRHIELVG